MERKVNGSRPCHKSPGSNNMEMSSSEFMRLLPHLLWRLSKINTLRCHYPAVSSTLLQSFSSRSHNFFFILYVPKPRIFISELLPDGAARIFPSSYAAAVWFKPTWVELHQTGAFEGRSTELATALWQIITCHKRSISIQAVCFHHILKPGYATAIPWLKCWCLIWLKRSILSTCAFKNHQPISAFPFSIEKSRVVP